MLSPYLIFGIRVKNLLLSHENYSSAESCFLINQRFRHFTMVRSHIYSENSESPPPSPLTTLIPILVTLLPDYLSSRLSYCPITNRLITNPCPKIFVPFRSSHQVNHFHKDELFAFVFFTIQLSVRKILLDLPPIKS